MHNKKNPVTYFYAKLQGVRMRGRHKKYLCYCLSQAAPTPGGRYLRISVDPLAFVHSFLLFFFF